MEVIVVRAGMLTTVQDLGRAWHRAWGVPSGGAVDAFALRMANLLVGNPEDTAALECTLVGPELVFSADTTIAVAGATFVGAPSWEPLVMRKGQRLDLGACRSGARGYIAFAGGVEVDAVMGSRSTYLPGGFGGIQGRAVQDGDALKVGAWTPSQAVERWHIDPRLLPEYSSSPILRAVPGAQAAEYGNSWQGAGFKVTAQSDRMGIRLNGPTLARSMTHELPSGAVSPGTVQVPPNGQPIILLADAQTLGGYPKLAHVITVDLPLAAQLRSGNTVGFKEVSLPDAHRLWQARERTLAIVREGLAQKLR